MSALLAVLASFAVLGQTRVPLTVPPGQSPGFRLLHPQDIGIHFTNSCPPSRHLTNQIYLNGSGVAAGDVDGDGRTDLFFAALDDRSSLFLNRGNWTFSNQTAAAGLKNIQDATGCALADLDGDGDLDLIVNTIGFGTRLFLNAGDGTFGESKQRLNANAGGMSLALADIDGDGDLDFYVANYRTDTIRDQPNTRFSIRMVDGKPEVRAVDGRPVSDPAVRDRFEFKFTLADGRGSFSHEENGEPDVLFLNDGKGNFQPRSFTDGSFLEEDGSPLKRALFDWGLSVMFRDVNNDGLPDLYVCNDFNSPDRFWINQGNAVFRAAPKLALRHTPLSSMGVDFADVNRDGLDDFIVLDMLSPDHFRRMVQKQDFRPGPVIPGLFDNRPQYPQNALFLNRGNGTYAEIASFSGVEASDWAWTPVFLDVDLDGYEDLLVSNGFERDAMHADVLMEIERKKAGAKLTASEQLALRRALPRLNTPNLAYKNLGNGRFQEMSTAWSFNLSGVSQGMALADLDNDGDLDVVLNNFNDPPTLYRNESSAPRLAVQLKGVSNVHGIGAKLKLKAGGIVQSQEMISGGRYLSSDAPLRVFAALDPLEELTVTWSSGKISRLTNLRANHLYVVEERESGPASSRLEIGDQPYFKDLSDDLAHLHVEQIFDDFSRQPMLPWKLSQSGPPLCWADLNGDGRDDLAIGGGKGGKLSLFLQESPGRFTPCQSSAMNQTATRDQLGLVSASFMTGPALLLTYSNYEDGVPVGLGVRRISCASTAWEEISPARPSSFGALSLLDYDRDGDLDLFVAGNTLPGQYPLPASSFLYAQSEGRFLPDPKQSLRFQNVGLITSACVSDLNEDGWSDLILATQWGPIRIFINQQGSFVEQTEAFGLAGYTGLWNSVQTGDFNGDGKIDLVAGNFGSNTFYERYRGKGIRLYHFDQDGNGIPELVEAYFHPEQARWVPLQSLDLLSKGMPGLGETFQSHAAFASSTVEKIIPKDAPYLQVGWLESTVFLNDGNRFIAGPLPMAAQLAPAFGVAVADFNGDAAEDLFLAQNFFAGVPERIRLDSGTGTLLLGKGDGTFTTLSPRESGIEIYGEGRAAALSDFDADGRIDLAVTQNGAATKLFRNLQGKPGIRVRLLGPGANPEAVGARITLLVDGNKLVTRELQAGSGYLSQNSFTQVIPKIMNSVLSIRWPNGTKQEYAVPEGAIEITVAQTEGLKIVR